MRYLGKSLRLLMIGTVGLALGGGGAAVAQDAEIVAIVESIRAELAKYQDVNVALADGYIPDPSGHCISAAAEGLPPEWGTMGIHYLNPARLQLVEDARINGMNANADPLAPPILLYEPQADGTLTLVAIELLVFQDAWMAAGNEGPPELVPGVMWNAMADDPATEPDEAHGFAPHYDLHIWAFLDNPAGMLAPFNPNATCEHHVDPAG